MELFLNATSPYARLVRVMVLEKGLAEAVTLRWCDPWADEAALLATNPAGRIPALVAADGTALSESLLIALYLDGLGQGASLLPAARLSAALHRAGLAQGLMDAAFATVIDRKHQGAGADTGTLGQRRWRAMQRILERLEGEIEDGSLAPGVTLGDLSVAVALDYLALRLPELRWAEDHPRLSAWQRRVVTRPSFVQTRFPSSSAG